ncbi:MAG: DUF4838 domain-containing protein [Chloroflexi bacterium OHK40]
MLARLGAPELPIGTTTSGPRIALEHGPDGDGFVRAPSDHGLTLRGDGPRGLLYAVYDLLEALGCRWPAPGAERIPRYTRVLLPTHAIADRPALERRGLVIGHDHALARAEEWISWAARNRLNTIVVHTTIRAPAFGACRLSSWRARRRSLLPLIRARGMRLELGGHHLRDLLPRRLFRVEPELFRHDGARRTADHNLCVSSPRALAFARRTAAAFFQAYPEAEVYHLWPDDLRVGGWCRCPRCAALSPADQALTAINALAEALPERRRTARVAYLAYHDTEEPPAAVAPHPAVQLLFAPRLRSYAEGIGGPANAPVANRLRRCAAVFTRPGSPGPALFEYYLDGILFKSAPPPLAQTIAADLRAYHGMGASAVYALLTGDRPLCYASPNAYCFARLAWAPDSDPAEILLAYATARAPRAATDLALAYAELAGAWRPILERSATAEAPGETIRPRDPVATPPADVLDAILAPRRAAERRLDAMATGADALARGRAAWDAAMNAEPGLAPERSEWELGALLLGFLHARQKLYVLADREAAPPLLAEALAEAQAALDAMLAWAQEHVPPAARGEHLLFRAPFQLQLDHIADRHLLTPLARFGLRVRRAGDLARYAIGLDWR